MYKKWRPIKVNLQEHLLNILKKEIPIIFWVAKPIQERQLNIGVILQESILQKGAFHIWSHKLSVST